jgi:hypothetical protein
MLTNERRLSFWSMICLWFRTRGVSPTDLIMRSMVVAGLHLANLMKTDLPRVRLAMANIFQLYREGKIKPRIDSVWPFEKVRIFCTKIVIGLHFNGELYTQIYYLYATLLIFTTRSNGFILL